MDFRATADHKSSSTLKSTKSTASNTANPRILESRSGNENHKTRRSRSFFSKSTSSDSTLESTFSHNAPCLSLRADLSAWQSIQKTAQLLESTFSQSHDSKSHAHSLSSRASETSVAIHKGAKADSSNAADFTTAKKVDSSLEAMDCHAIATALARNDRKIAPNKKVDSRQTTQKSSRKRFTLESTFTPQIQLECEKLAQLLESSFYKNAFSCHIEPQAKYLLSSRALRQQGVAIHNKKVDSSKQAQNVSKQPQDSGIFDETAQSVFDSHTTGGRICDEKAGLCSLLRGDKTGGLSHKQKANSPLFRAKPTPKPRPSQRLAL